MVPLDNQKLLKITLETINSGAKLSGAHKLQEELKAAGIDVSVSSAGRYLLKFEEEDYIAKAENGTRRVLTSKGLKKLASFNLFDERSKTKELFMEFLTETTMENMIDRLIVRRCIETEAAKLAATNISDEGINEIVEILNEEIPLNISLLDHAPDQEMMDKEAVLDSRFHAAIVKNSGNDFLWNIFKLIEISTKMQSFYSFITGHRIQDHINIVESLRMRDADAVSQQIHTHISAVIESCSTYCDAKKAMGGYLQNSDLVVQGRSLRQSKNVRRQIKSAPVSTGEHAAVQ